MRRVPWDILFALLVGIGIGLGYAWGISPLRVFDAEPSALRADFKDKYRSLIAAAYAADGNLPRAEARLALLGDSNSVEALNGQAQRMRASSQVFERADLVAALALSLDRNGSQESTSDLKVPTPTVEEISNEVAAPPPTNSLSSPSESQVPAESSETPQTIETQTLVIESTPRPTSTATPAPGKPFRLTEQETICDPNLPNGLLQVMVLSSNRRQIAGVAIDITWDGGSEQFFTGLKPELGNGYADYTLTANITYSVQVARGSEVASGLTAPTCPTNSGEAFLGGIKLTFQQP